MLSVGVLFALVGLLAADAGDSVLSISSSPLGAPPPAIITFDAPGAGAGPFQGTLAFAINPGGTIAGYYFDPNPVTHGFVRHGRDFHHIRCSGWGHRPLPRHLRRIYG